MKKFDPSKPVRTVGLHLPARIICDDRKGAYPFVVLVEHGGSEYADVVDSDGRGDAYVIENIPQKIVRYVNIYPGYQFKGVSSRTRREADAVSTSHRRACIRVEFEEGQFDD